MESLNHTCDNCNSKFTVKYDINECDDDPSFCPFCAEKMIETDFSDDDE